MMNVVCHRCIIFPLVSAAFVLKIKRYSIYFLIANLREWHTYGLCGLGHTQTSQCVQYIWELAKWITKKLNNKFLWARHPYVGLFDSEKTQ